MSDDFRKVRGTANNQSADVVPKLLYSVSGIFMNEEVVERIHAVAKARQRNGHRP